MGDQQCTAHIGPAQRFQPVAHRLAIGNGREPVQGRDANGLFASQIAIACAHGRSFGRSGAGERLYGRSGGLTSAASGHCCGWS